MKLWLYPTFIFTLLLGTTTFGQSEIIDKVFPNLSVEKRSELEIIDTIQYDYMFWDNYNYYSYQTRFGLSDFEFFLIYRHKGLDKVGLIVYGADNFYATDATADSIYFLKPKDMEYSEYYDEEGNYYGEYIAKSVFFGFETAGKETALWTITVGDKYAATQSGNIKRDLFKAVSFTEVVSEEYGNYVTGVFANLSNNKIYNSAVLNEGLVRSEVYAYRYDSYYYGEYDYYYDYENPDIDYTVPYFETRLNYEPVEIIYLMSGDTISELISFAYAEANPLYYSKKTVPETYSGVWKGETKVVDEVDQTELVIIDGDEIYSSFGIMYSSIDAYDDTYQFGSYEFNAVMAKLNLSAGDQKKAESMWLGSKTAVNFIGITSWTFPSRFKDYYISDGESMMHIYLEYNGEGGVNTVIEMLTKQQVYEKLGLAEYDSYNYVTTVNDESGNKIPLTEAGVEYYYNYNMSVSDRNIDAQGNLILTNESLGSINFKAFSYGENYLGNVRVQWIGEQNLEDGGTIVNIKSMPFKIVDQNKTVLCDNIYSMYVTNVQGFNLYQITNSESKVGVMGPDGTWLIKQEWDAINILGPSSAYGYESVSLPAFFVVYKGTSCGALDAKGNWIVPMGQEYIEICKNEILVTKEGKLTIYSFDGKMLISGLDGVGGGYYGYATDCYSYDFSASGNRVLVKDEKYGIVDENFNVIVPFEYTYMTPITNSGQFIATNAEGKYGIIGADGQIALPFEYDNITPFDYAPNRLVAGKDNKQGVIDSKGNVLIPFEFYSISSYSDWYSNMIYVSDPDYRTNIIDTTGHSIIDAPCGFVYLYPSWSILMCADQGKIDFYNINGELLYTKVAEYMDPYSCYDYIQIFGMGSFENPKYGAFDITSGEEIMPAEFESLYPFWINEELFFAGYSKGKVGIYSSTGEVLVKPKGYYLDNYYYDDGYYGGEVGYFVEISNKKGKSKVIRLNW